MIIQNNTYNSIQKPSSFKGLTRYFSSGFHNAQELLDAAKKYPKNNGIIGSLPPEWINKIPKAERAKKIKHLYSDLAKIFEQPIIGKKYIQEAQSALDKAFKKSKIIQERQNIIFNILSNEGSFGRTYSLRVPISDKGSKNYVVKHYRSNLPAHVGSDALLVHGNYVEQNAAFYLQNDFYSIPRKISKLGSEIRQDWHRGDLPNIFFSDLKRNYAVFEDARFLGDPLRTSPTMDSGINCNDRRHNIVNDYIIDYGGYEETTPIITSNKTARSVYKRIKKAKNPLEQLSFYIKNVDKFQNAKDVYAGITAVLIDINSSRIESFGLSLNVQIKLTQKIIDMSYDKIKDTLTYDFLKNHLTSLKVKQKLQDSINIDELLK